MWATADINVNAVELEDLTEAADGRARQSAVGELAEQGWTGDQVLELVPLSRPVPATSTL